MTPRLPPGRRIELPGFVFSRSRYWVTGAPPAGPAQPALAGGPVSLPDGRAVLSAAFDPARQPWLTDHVVRDTALVPATALLSLTAEAGSAVGCPRIEELTVGQPLPLPGQGAVEIRVLLEPADASGRRAASVHGRAPDGTAWTEHATAVLSPAEGTAPEAPQGTWPPADAEPVEPADAYDRLARRGYHYGPAFRGLRRAWTRGDETYAEVTLDQDVPGVASATAHPALLDAALHAALLSSDDDLNVPFAWRDVTLPPSDTRTLRVRTTAGETGLSVFCTDEQGRPVATVGSLVLRPLLHPASFRPVSPRRSRPSSSSTRRYRGRPGKPCPPPWSD